MAAETSFGPKRLAALTVGVLIVAAPLLWLWWSLAASADAEEAIRVQSATLAALNKRLAALSGSSSEAGAIADAKSLYLPGGTDALAGAALQRIVADRIGEAGGRLAESEIADAAAAASDEPGRVSLRVSFDADIVALQKVVFDLETGVPFLVVKSLEVQAGDALGTPDTESPKLRVVMQVEGHRET